MTAVRVITITADELREIIREELRALQVQPAAPPPPKRRLTVREAAERAGCSEDTIRAWIAEGRLTEYRVGAGRGHYRIDADELDRALVPPQRPAPIDADAAVVDLIARRR